MCKDAGPSLSKDRRRAGVFIFLAPALLVTTGMKLRKALSALCQGYLDVLWVASIEPIVSGMMQMGLDEMM